MDNQTLKGVCVMRRWAIISCVALFGTTTAWMQAPSLKKESSIMERKLFAAQKLLAALAQNDFAAIKENAEVLNDLSKQAAWKMIETPRYEQYSDEFQRLTLRMANQAREKNLDGAALSYVDMTLVCIKCHQHVREQKIGLRTPMHDRNPVATR
jgi:hypothetical protein